MELPNLCACGEIVRYSNEDCCEDCFIVKSERYHGRSQRVVSYPWMEAEHAENQAENQSR